ncbi:deoxyribodipyrimidine photo-lyase [Asticcacaulis sp. AND118]|uniref:cryptochrome/photolyase family protein n=1 Tax=Asticcacaulis sp. AND118 TaxID=2840468 RepID=UPI001CFFFD5A|nr:deoxyribodipyrimidine photo-lyase [Asticcacaulis sp. AND118]UDF02371.1 DNA photolyase family protein [Asticcacaulis sp. AND118]
MTQSTLLWFRSDLRLQDHEGVAAALRSGRPVIPVYIHDEDIGQRPLGAASKWWLDRSLRALDKSLRAHGSRLIVLNGASETVLKKLVEAVSAAELIASRTFEPKIDAFDSGLAETLGIDVRIFNTHLLGDPTQIVTGEGHPYKVFTPFYRALQSHGAVEGHALPAPALRWPPAARWPESLDIDELGLKPALTPSGLDWTEGFDIWTPGEDGAHQRLSAFLEDGLKDYARDRDRPDLDITSRLSPHLRFGEISPHRILHAAENHVRHRAALRDDLEKFRAELAWRDFSYNILQQQPKLDTRNFKSQFDGMAWRNDPAGLRAWQRGETGYGLVDAGMRELWRTGFMHNRVRMVCASFLAKHLLIDWRLGEQWFWDTLVDADPANNTASWQWVAGSGADAAPYFRIFNPVTQAEKFDPKNLYQKRYISGFTENRPSKSGMKQQKFERNLFEFAGISSSKSQQVSRLIVDHAEARQRALDAYAQMKED